MPRFGQYSTVTEIHRGGLGSVWSARSEADSRVRFAIKTCVPDVDIIGQHAAEAAVRLFIEQAAVQQKLGRASDSAWASIHEYGRVTAEDAAASAAEAGEEAPSAPPIGAYYVTDLCGRSSVERVLGSRVRLDVRGIAAIMRAVLAGLKQIRHVCGRPHGNLRPTNILLAGDGEADKLKVLLADPLPTSAVDAQRDERGDVRVLGEVLYSLVTLRPFRVRSAGAPEESSEWARLPGGAKWRELCEKLTDPDPGAERPGLEEVEATVEKLAQPVAGRKKVALIGGVAALAAAIAAAVLIPRGGHKPKEPPLPPPSEAAATWKQACEDYLGWFGMFMAELQKKPTGPGLAGFATRRELYKSDPHLRGLVEKIEGAAGPLDPSVIGGGNVDLARAKDEAPKEALSEKGVRQTASLAGVMGAVKEGVLDKGWKVRSDCEEVAQGLEEAGLKNEAEFVRKPGLAVDELGVKEEASGRSLARAIDTLISMAQEARPIQAQLGAIAARRTALKGSDDPVLAAMADFFDEQLRARARAEAMNQDGIKDLRRGLEEDATLGGRVDRFMAEAWAKTDKGLFREHGVVYAALAKGEKVTGASIGAWLDEAKDYPALSQGEDPRRDMNAAGLLKEVRDSRGELDAAGQPPSVEEVAKIDGAAKRLEEIGARPWNVRTRAGIEGDYRQLQLELVDLRRSLLEQRRGLVNSDAELRRQLLADTVVVPSSPERTHAALNAYWGAERDKLMGRFTPERYRELNAAAKKLREGLADLDRGVPGGLETQGQAVAWWAAIAKASWEERDRMIGEALATAEASSQSLADMQARVTERYGAWKAPAEKLVGELRRAESMLAEAYGWSEAAPDGVQLRTLEEGWKDAALLKASGVSAATAPLVSRVAALRELEGAGDAAALARVVGSAQEGPERRLNAWRRLGALGWPSGVAPLREELDLARAVDAVVSEVPDKARRELLGAEMVRERAERWKRCFARLVQPADIEAADGLIRDFGVDAHSLPAGQQYNLLLAGLRRGFLQEGMTDEQATAAINGFAQQARALEGGGGVAARPEVGGLIDRLNKLIDPNAAPATVLPTTLGPGSLSPAWEGNGDGPSLRFTRTVGASSVTLWFLRVDKDEAGAPLGDGAFYLSATEVSLKQFTGIVEVAGLGKDLPNVLYAMGADRADTEREGPCVWTTRDGRRIVVTDEWLRGNRSLVNARHTLYPDDLRDRNDPSGRKIAVEMKPTEDHPMQQLSPTCAMLVARAAGCQLPTPGQWKAAYAQASADGQARVFNLRDATWKKQFDHIKATQEALLRENSVFVGFELPDKGAFGKADGAKAEPVSGAADDGYLWFAPVGNDGPVGGVANGGFKHLRGNVAEMVVDAAAPATGPATVRAVVAYLKQNAGKIGVIGGSALSSEKAPWDQPQPMPDLSLNESEPDAGYADVGFRLAFSAKGSAPARRPLAVRAREVLEADGKYLPPG